MQRLRWILSLALVLAASSARAQSSDFKLVVNASNSLSSLGADEAAAYFLKKKTSWPGGQPVQPVDLTDESAARRSFTKLVLRKDVAAVKSYWQTQIFSGRGVPPPEKGSDAAVLAFVEANPGAIGYVSAAAVTGRGVREVRLD